MYKYVHGGDVYESDAGCLDFSANVNPLGLPASVRMAIKHAAADCSAYPDPFCRVLTQALSEWHKVAPQSILCGNGAADLLFKLALAIKPQQTLLLAPTFADYEKALRTVGSAFEYYCLGEEKGFRIEKDILLKVGGKNKLVVICNPNNPTGQIMQRELLLEIVEKAARRGINVLVDECFMEFVGKDKDYSLIGYTAQYSNLLVLRAFTKSFAMAGVRLGYLITGNGQIIDACRENSQDWSVSSLAQAAGLAALTERNYLEKSRSYVYREREYLLKNMAALGVLTFAPSANYILCKTELRDMAVLLRQQDILVRDCSNYRGLTTKFFRIAVRRRSENRLLINALKEIMKNENTIGCD